jgi:hypothetical protein
MYIQPKRHVGETVFFLCRAKSSNGPEMPALGYGTIKVVQVCAFHEDGKDEAVDITYRVHVGSVYVYITDADILSDGLLYPAMTLGSLRDEVKAADDEAAMPDVEKAFPDLPVQEDERG